MNFPNILKPPTSKINRPFGTPLMSCLSSQSDPTASCSPFASRSSLLPSSWLGTGWYQASANATKNGATKKECKQQHYSGMLWCITMHNSQLRTLVHNKNRAAHFGPGFARFFSAKLPHHVDEVTGENWNHLILWYPLRQWWMVIATAMGPAQILPVSVPWGKHTKRCAKSPGFFLMNMIRKL